MCEISERDRRELEENLNRNLLVSHIFSVSCILDSLLLRIM
jgi:hypothetical protein